MAWNEPGGNGNNHDPWSGGGRGGRNDQGPPDLDEALKKFQDKLNRMLGRRGAPQGQGGGHGLLVVVLVVLAGLWIAGGVYLVDQTERGVVLRLGRYHETVGPGLHWNPPLIDTVTKVNVTQIRSISQKATMLTLDENIVQVSLSVQYQVQNPKDYLLNVRSPEQSLENATDSALRHEVGSSNMNAILTEGREMLAQNVSSRLQSYLDNYGVGLELRAVNVESTAAPDEVQAAFDDVIKAREDKQRAINQASAYQNSVLPEAKGQAQRVLEEAEGYRQSVIASANGEAQRFSALLDEYQKAPEVTRERLYLQSIQEVLGNTSKVMVDVEGGNNMLYLPLDKLMQNAGVETRSRVNSSMSPVNTSTLSDVEMDELAERVIQRLRIRQDDGIRREGR